MSAHGFFCNFGKADTFDLRGGTGKEAINESLIETNRFEHLGATVRLIGRDAHLGHDFVEALADSLDVVLLTVLGSVLVLAEHVGDCLK